MSWGIRTVLPGCLLLAVTAGPAVAQPPPDPAEQGRVQMGPLTVDTKVELKNVGVDSNVFNEAENPRDDFTATVSPRITAALRFGAARLSYGSTIDVVYFQTYKDEQSINRSGEARFELRTTRFAPFVWARGLQTRERLNSEIDARARYTDRGYGAGADVLLTERTALRAEVSRGRFEFGEDEAFRGVSLRERLDQRTDAVRAGVRFELTPFTMLDVDVTAARDRFVFSPRRDADSLRIAPTISFHPAALISGSATVGYRQFTPLDRSLPEYRGLVAAAALSYTILGRTRIDTRVHRDVHFSFEEAQPYYLLTGVRFTVTQLIAGPVDVQAVGGRERLAYRSIDTIADPESATIDVYGGGVGYRFGESARLGFNVEFAERRARPADRTYKRTRTYAALSYDF